ncbi:MAG: hypothetical protein P4L51_01055 [Puia sp.]|nr:hypothetical protein [Puia sp.]
MKQNIQSKLLPYSRYGSFYREREGFYRSFTNQYYLEFAHELLDQKVEAPFLTNTIIAPNDIQFGASPRKVIWKIGMPSFLVKDINDFKDHKILFYKTRLLRQKVLLQFHFIQGIFYYSQLSFLSFTEKTNDILANSIKAKYQCSGDFTDSDKTHLVDICGNRLVIEKGVYLTVSYITSDTYPRKLMEEQIRLKREVLNKADNYEISRLNKML